MLVSGMEPILVGILRLVAEVNDRYHSTTEAPHLSLRENVLQHDNNLI
jgi:hypothetical protein